MIETIAMPTNPTFEPITEPIDPMLVRAEVAQFDKPVAKQGTLEAYIADAKDIPSVLHEIGRLREVCFRAVGEGTGKSIDLEKCDEYYLHLFLWDSEQHCIAGAYRLGCTDKILAKYGPSGLLTTTFYDFEQPFVDFLNPGLELGRAFVALSHQKSIFALSLLWKGIACFVVENPQYAKLFGTVSISNDYTPLSKDLMVQYMRKNKRNQEFSKYVTPLTPYQSELPSDYGDISSMLTNIEEVSARVTESEPDGKSIPVLLRQYLKLNATLLEFSIDLNFNNALDALVLVDLRKAPDATLMRYMSKQGFAKFKQSEGKY